MPNEETLGQKVNVIFFSFINGKVRLREFRFVYVAILIVYWFAILYEIYIIFLNTQKSHSQILLCTIYIISQHIQHKGVEKYNHSVQDSKNCSINGSIADGINSVTHVLCSLETIMVYFRSVGNLLNKSINIQEVWVSSFLL